MKSLTGMIKFLVNVIPDFSGVIFVGLTIWTIFSPGIEDSGHPIFESALALLGLLSLIYFISEQEE